MPHNCTRLGCTRTYWQSLAYQGFTRSSTKHYRTQAGFKCAITSVKDYKRDFTVPRLGTREGRTTATMRNSRDVTERDLSPPKRASTSIRRPMHIDLEAQSPTHTNDNDAEPIHSPPESVRQRRINRSNTAKTYRPQRRGQSWQPGQEPGIDTSAPVDQYSSSTAPKFNEKCQITTVDYSQTEMQQHELDNHTLEQFMAKPRPDWAICRWINVNGLSWDVVKLLGNHYGLHRLAIEDLLNPRNRTKADWYTDHTFSMSDTVYL